MAMVLIFGQVTWNKMQYIVLSNAYSIWNLSSISQVVFEKKDVYICMWQSKVSCFGWKVNSTFDTYIKVVKYNSFGEMWSFIHKKPI